MKILLHTCCGPCTLAPLEVLRDQGHEVHGYFFNPNIHPFREFKRRIAALEEVGRKLHFKVDIDRNYGLKEYLRQVVFHEESRCRLCYAMRLEPTVQRARELGADAFTTTLLYSKYQKHELIRSQCASLAETYGVPFLYQDFRVGWQAGIDKSLEMDLYRQPYCGCIYSEQERYDRKMRKKKKAGAKTA